MKTSRRKRAAVGFDAFMNLSYGRVAAGTELPSNDEIRRRNLAEYQADLAAEEQAAKDAAALAERNAEEERLGISGMMQKVREHDARENERLSRVYSRGFDILARHAEDRGEYAADKFHTMVLQDTPCERSPEDVVKVSDAFFATLENEGITLTEDARRRVLVYVGMNGLALADKGVFIDPMANGTWRAALSRLEELGMQGVTRKSTPQPKRAEITSRSDPAYDKQVVFDDLVEVGGSLFAQWLQSLEQNFSFRPSKEQLDAAVNLLEHRQLPLHEHSSFDIVRTSLVRQHVWPSHLLTKDERIADLTEQYTMSDPAQRRQFFIERNKILFET